MLEKAQQDVDERFGRNESGEHPARLAEFESFHGPIPSSALLPPGRYWWEMKLRRLTTRSLLANAAAAYLLFE